MTNILHTLFRRRKGALLATTMLFVIGSLWSSAGMAQNVNGAAAKPNSRAVERIAISTVGDTFPAISLREFGTAAFARLIAEYNGITFNTVLSAGQLIKIPVAAAPTAEAASVVYAKGRALLLVRGNRGQIRDIKIGDDIHVNDIIKTTDSGFVSMRFPSGSVVNVQPMSLVKLVQLDCLSASDNCVVGLNAMLGRISSHIQQRGDQPTRFRVRTPHASAAVRGTVFDIDASDEQILLGVTEGDVELSAQGRSTEVAEGLGVRTLAGQPSDPPVRLLPPPSFQRVPPRITSEDTLVWLPLSDAERYSVTIAGDEQGSALAYQFESDGLSHQINPLPAGGYFVLLRGIDSLGFQGFVNTAPIVVADIDETAASPTLGTVTDGGQLFVNALNLAEGIEEFEVQLSFGPAFLDVSSVDVPVNGGIQVAPAEIPTYVRARSILGPSTVSQFGPALTLPAQ